MQEQDGFFTFKGYQLQRTVQLTSSMEDYLEMICRLLQDTGIVRVRDLAERLHVKPSSASKMAANLAREGYLEYRRYGHVTATAKGLAAGAYLLHRHEVVHDFLCLLNGSENELEEAEKIEHFLSEKTIKNLEKWILSMKKAPPESL